MVARPTTVQKRAKELPRSYAASALLVRTLADVPECALIRQADGSVGFFAQYDQLTLVSSKTLCGGGQKKQAGTTDEEELALLEERFGHANETLRKRARMEMEALQKQAEDVLKGLDERDVEARRAHTAHTARAVDEVQLRLAISLHQLEEVHTYNLAELKHVHRRQRLMQKPPHHLPPHHHHHLGAAKGSAPVDGKSALAAKVDEHESNGASTDDEEPLPKLVGEREQRAVRRWCRLGDELRELQHIKARAAAVAVSLSPTGVVR